MKIKHIILSAALLSAPSLFAATLPVTPGSLRAALTGDQGATLRSETQLTLKGSMDARDFEALVELTPALKDLDLSAVTIADYRPAKPLATGQGECLADQLPVGALMGKHLQSLKLPATLTVIGDEALAANDFQTLTVPATVTRIGQNALYGCRRLTAIALPASVTELGRYALADCTSLTSADLSATPLTAVPGYLFEGDTALTDIKLPATAAEIGQGAFLGCTALEGYTIPASVRVIGAKAYAGSGLSDIVIPEGVSRVGEFAFAMCPALTGATLLCPEAELGDGLFFADPEFVALNADGLTAYPPYLFARNPKTKLPEDLDGLVSIGDYALSGNSASTLKLGSTIVYLGDGAMQDMDGLTYIDAHQLPGVPELGNDVFEGIPQADVDLKVADEQADDWKADGQWGKFRISAFVDTGMTTAPVAERIKAFFRGSVLNVVSEQDILRIDVYDTAGRTMAGLEPDDTRAEIDTEGMTGRIYVVRVQTADGATVFKLTR